MRTIYMRCIHRTMECIITAAGDDKKKIVQGRSMHSSWYLVTHANTKKKNASFLCDVYIFVNFLYKFYDFKVRVKIFAKIWQLKALLECETSKMVRHVRSSMGH